MPDKFDIRGDEIFFGGYSVAFISPMLPATVRDRVQTALLDFEQLDAAAEYSKGYDDGERSRNEEVSDLQKEIEALQKEIKALERDLEEANSA